jgi:hypothetical protein
MGEGFFSVEGFAFLNLGGFADAPQFPEHEKDRGRQR